MSTTSRHEAKQQDYPYDNNEISRLLRCYLGGNENLTILDPIDAKQLSGEALKENLRGRRSEENKEEVFTELPSRSIVLSINLRNNHWVCAFIDLKNKTTPKIYFADPLGCNIAPEAYYALNSLCPHAKFIISKVKLQDDEYYSGPWIIEILRYLASGGVNLGELSGKINIENCRKQQAKDFLEYAFESFREFCETKSIPPQIKSSANNSVTVTEYDEDHSTYESNTEEDDDGDSDEDRAEQNFDAYWFMRGYDDNNTGFGDCGDEDDTENSDDESYFDKNMPEDKGDDEDVASDEDTDEKKSEDSDGSNHNAEDYSLDDDADAEEDYEQVKETPQYGIQAKSPIKISYRNDQGKHMHGAFFDHYVMRRIAEHETEIAAANIEDVKTFLEFSQQTTHTLGFGDALGEKIIQAITDKKHDKTGLLFIPGRSREGENAERDKFEQELIKDARNHGRPILAICAGSWQLWKAYGGETKDRVKDHVYSSMPYILDSGGIGNNKQIHGVNLSPGIVRGAVRTTQWKEPEAKQLKYLTVNSVHWAAPDEKTIPVTLQVSAVSVQDQKIIVKNRTSQVMQPESNIVEAFESKSGAPVIGIQWHPEAYYSNEKNDDSDSQWHLNIIKYMALAGDAYSAKCRMLDEFKEHCSKNQHAFFCSDKHATPSNKSKADEDSQEKAHDPEDLQSHNLLSAKDNKY